MKSAIISLAVAAVGALVLSLAGCFLIPPVDDDYSAITEAEAQAILEVFGDGAETLAQLGTNPSDDDVDAVVTV